MSHWSIVKFVSIVPILCLNGGCGCGSNGPQRYALSGSVSFDDEAVPRGNVWLEPDSEKGNRGPSVVADIHDGMYSIPAAKGTVGGPHRVRIVGLDGIATRVGGAELPEGKSLFPDYKTTVDLPAEHTTYDFEFWKKEEQPKNVKRP